MDTTTLALFKKLESRIRDVDIRQGGPRGPKGRKGDRGLIGPSGTQGNQGPHGAKGQDGTKGATGSKGSTGATGRNGVDGLEGLTGPAGLDGIAGLDGDDGVSVTDARIDFDGHLTLQLSDGTEIDAGLIQMSSDGDITYVAGGGIPDQYKKDLQQVIEDLNDHLADFNNPHQVAHDQLIDSNTTGAAWVDKHHSELHDLDSHTDVTIANPVPGQGIFFDGVEWNNRAGYMESWPTGLANGGELNIGPGINDIEVIAGIGVVLDNYTDPLAPPVAQGLEWSQINEPITAAPAVAGSIVWFTLFDTGIAGTPIGNIPINVAGLRQYAQAPSPTLARQEIPIGFAVHNGVVWLEVSSPKVINQTAETLREYITSVQDFTTIIEGGTVLEQPAFMLSQEAGTVWENNRSWHVSKSDPNREALPASDPIVFEYLNRDFTVVGAPTSTIDPTIWDNAGVVEAVPFPVNNTTIQRVYLDPANNYWILLGQTVYPNFLTAQANLPADEVVVPFLLQNSILLGFVIAERGKTDWDIDEAVFDAAGSGGGGSGGGGTPITDHNNLNGITPNDHHNQVHLLYGSDHSDVNTAAGLLTHDGLYWDGAQWFTGRRTRAIGDYVQGVTYNAGDELFNGADLSEARIDGVTSSPFVAAQGTPAFLYDGVGMANNAQLATQIIFGNRYTTAQGFYITGFRVNVVAGNEYTLYYTTDPLAPVPIFTLVLSFTADVTGWKDIASNALTVPAGGLFDVIALVKAPDPTPVEVIAQYDYQAPQNPTVPLAGQIQHSRGDPAEMRVSYTDNVAGDRTALIQSLGIGDTITDGVLNWSVQSNTDMVTWAALIVAPANTSSAGIKDFTFGTVAPTPTSVPSDPAFWPGSAYPALQGVIGVDVPYSGITLDTNAYGVDIFIQPAYQPDTNEWKLKIVGGGGGGGGGDFTPTTFTGAGSTGYVPDPITESGRMLQDDGGWTGMIEDSAGNVGIGITTPTGILHVNNEAAAPATLRLTTSGETVAVSNWELQAEDSYDAFKLVNNTSGQVRMAFEGPANNYTSLGKDFPEHTLDVFSPDLAQLKVGSSGSYAEIFAFSSLASQQIGMRTQSGVDTFNELYSNIDLGISKGNAEPYAIFTAATGALTLTNLATGGAEQIVVSDSAGLLSITDTIDGGTF